MNLVIFAFVLLGLAWVAFTTFRNGQPTGSIARILHDTEQPRPRGYGRGGR